MLVELLLCVVLVLQPLLWVWQFPNQKHTAACLCFLSCLFTCIAFNVGAAWLGLPVAVIFFAMQDAWLHTGNL